CVRWHWHSPANGHRIAHCHNAESPYAVHGYVLCCVGPAPPEILVDLTRRVPRGPHPVSAIQGGEKRPSTPPAAPWLDHDDRVLQLALERMYRLPSKEPSPPVRPSPALVLSSPLMPPPRPDPRPICQICVQPIDARDAARVTWLGWSVHRPAVVSA